MPSPASIEPLDVNGRVSQVRVAGEVDLENAEAALERLLELVPDDAAGLVVDLTGLRYVDSAGIRTFVELSSRLSRNGQQLALVVPAAAPTSRVFTLVKLDLLVPIYERLESAAAAIDSGGLS